MRKIDVIRCREENIRRRKRLYRHRKRQRVVRDACRTLRRILRERGHTSLPFRLIFRVIRNFKLKDGELRQTGIGRLLTRYT